ncbi:MAG TPA: hypothetical protein DIU35_01410 [Candidatus Latescibacteria bacterium]|nr:hypothetical protein [Gemmatimonadota bacterium]HCR16114.1 hypothetical protein [Candidatus Latescibacterota bacterium]
MYSQLIRSGRILLNQNYWLKNSPFESPSYKIGWAPEVLEAVYRYFKDPVFAKALRHVRARPRHDLFQTRIDPDELSKAAKELRGPLGVES